MHQNADQKVHANEANISEGNLNASNSFSPPSFAPTAGPAFQLTPEDEDPTTESVPWSVSSEGGTVTFKIGSGEAEKTETHTAATVREFIIKNYNWNGIVQLMKGIAEKDSAFSYTVPTNLGGTTSDDSIIIPDSAITAIIRLQAKYQVETKYSENSTSKIKEILKGVDGQPKTGFASNILGTTYTDLIKESDNTSMKNGDTEFTMPNLETADEKTIYDFLRNLVISRNGLWSDEEHVTNMVSIRRTLETSSSKYNDTMFVAWKDTEGGKPHNAQQYIGSTEPGSTGSTGDGQLLPQTTTMVPGIHTGGSSGTPGGRTMNAYRKKDEATGKYFQGTDTTMNVHYGHPAMDGLPKSYGLDKNYGGEGYDDGELEAYSILIGLFHVLTEWGSGRGSKNISAYKNLQRWAKDYSRGEAKELDGGDKQVEISDGGDKAAKTLNFSSYKSNIDKNYANTKDSKTKAKRKDRAIKLLTNYRTADGGALSADDKKAYEDMDLKALRTELKKEAVWLSVIDLQLKEEVNMGQVDANPGGGTVGKLEKDDKTAAADTKEYTEKKAKAKLDKPKVDTYFESWDKNSTLKDNTSLKTRFQNSIKINESDYDLDDAKKVDDKGGKGMNKSVGGWSEGCQIVLGGQNFYDYMYNSTQYVNETKQQRWYYTLVDIDSISGVTKGEPAATTTTGTTK